MAMSPALRQQAFRLFIGLLAAVVAVGGLTAIAVDVLDLEDETDGVATGAGDGSTSTVPARPGPGPGQAFVTGTVSAVHIEGANVDPIPTPFEVTTPERGQGAGATFEAVDVDGEVATIDWTAGTPLTFESDGGALVVGPVVLDADANAITIGLDGVVHGFRDAGYSLTGSVAVGVAGIARPRDAVDFVATSASTVSFAGGATTVLAPQALVIRGPGRVVLQGQLNVERSDGSDEVTSVELPQGPFQVTLTPVPGGYTIDAVLQGDTLTG
jgi:hypothetical protein